ncbi:MAG TPA: L-threonylcarbamoyladenylate synthase [Abditibacteriaceae bacterium]|jgi:L-threonylcarbamoyladenylate synthase
MNRIDDATLQRIHDGSLVVFPTETIYGLGCIATDAAAVARLFAVKGREPGKPPPLLVPDEALLSTLVEEIPDFAQQLMQQHWPGALTLVLRARPALPWLVTGLNAQGQPTVAVRRSAHPVARELCEMLQAPLVATSANFAGATGKAANPQSLGDVAAELLARVEIVLDGGTVGGLPSTIVDCSGAAPRVLRQGALQLPF